MVPFYANSQENKVPNVEQGPNFVSSVSSMVHIQSLASRPNDLIPSENTKKEAQDKRSLGNKVIIGKDRQIQDDYYVRNRHEMEQSIRVTPLLLVFDAYTTEISPSDPDIAIGPNHVFVTFNKGFTIYDKAGNQLLAQTEPFPAIFPSGGCCDLTVSYDNAADRWVLSFLGTGAQIAVSDGPDPINDGWYVYSMLNIDDYQKLSIWSDGYYMTDNSFTSNKVWALQRNEMLVGNPIAGIQSFDLPGIVIDNFYSPQVFHVTNGDLPAAGGATIVYMQDDAFDGIATDHIKLWNLDVDWFTPSNSTISAAQEIPATPFISVFDGGSFSNLSQPGGGQDIDALQAIIMQQAHFRRMGTHNSALFNFVVDTDASSEELAGIRWYEFRQSGDNQPWSLYQEGTYIAPDGRHAWTANLAMDSNGNIALGYTSMAGPTTPNPTNFKVSSYYTGRFANDPLGIMTVSEELIGNGTNNLPNSRYGDYSKIDLDPSDDSTFWFINEYMKSERTGVVGKFVISPNTITDDIGATTILSPVNGPFTSSEEVTIFIRNFGINDITNPEVQYNINGGAPVIETYSGTISGGSIVEYSFVTQADLSGSDTYIITAATNLSGDSNPDNNSVSKVVSNATLYCSPYLNCSEGDGFRLFSLQEIDNESGCEGYGDFTNLIANLDEDMTYDLTITTNYGDQHLNVWIDFTDDGLFTPNELFIENYVLAEGESTGVFTETLDLVIPTGVPNGLHRLRAKINWNAPVPEDACEVTNFGETEDYSVQIGELGIEDQSIVAAELVVLTLPNKQFDISLITEFDGVASIAISNVLGQTLAFNNLEKEGNSYRYHLDMSYADTGVYFIKIGDRNSRTYKTAKIIVK